MWYVANKGLYIWGFRGKDVIWPNGIIFLEPRFHWNKGSHFPFSATFWGPRHPCEVAIIWPDVRILDLPPTQDVSHRQDCTFMLGDASRPSFCHCYWVEGISNVYICIYVMWQELFIFQQANMSFKKSLGLGHPTILTAIWEPTDVKYQDLTSGISSWAVQGSWNMTPAQTRHLYSWEIPQNHHAFASFFGSPQKLGPI